MPNTKDDLDVLAEVMIENPQLRLTVFGHTTKDEALAARSKEEHLGLADRRIGNVIEYLKSHGISEDRFKREVMNDSEPDSYEGTMVAKAKNRRVTFKKQ